MSEMNSEERIAEEQALTFIQLMGSVFAAALGVQSDQNRARDFERGKPSHFIAIGIIFTAFFVILMMLFVKLVLGMVG